MIEKSEMGFDGVIIKPQSKERK